MAADGAALVAAAVTAAIRAKAPRRTVAATAAAVASVFALGATRAGAAAGPRTPAEATRPPAPAPDGASAEELLEAWRATRRAQRKRKRERRRAARGGGSDATAERQPEGRPVAEGGATAMDTSGAVVGGDLPTTPPHKVPRATCTDEGLGEVPPLPAFEAPLAPTLRVRFSPDKAEVFAQESYCRLFHTGLSPARESRYQTVLEACTLRQSRPPDGGRGA